MCFDKLKLFVDFNVCIDIIFIIFKGGNGLTGEVPTELGNLVNLKYIAIGENYIVLLFFYSNDYRKSLNYMSLLLVCIHAGDQNITGTLPSEFGNIASLEYLYIRECGL